jgi:L-threonylcarbamoyladenylate synthase
VKDDFCRYLIKRLGKPIVSTSANISGEPSPKFFDEIADKIRTGVDYIVQWRKGDKMPAQPSQIIRWKRDGTHEIIRS